MKQRKTEHLFVLAGKFGRVFYGFFTLVQVLGRGQRTKDVF